MVNFKHSLLVGLVIFTYSCTKEPKMRDDTNFTRKITLSSDEVVSITHDDISDINENDVKDIVSDFLSAFSEKGITRNSPVIITIKNKFNFTPLGDQKFSTRLADTDDLLETTPIYEVAIKQDKGTSIALVAADKRVSQVIYWGADIDRINDMDTKITLSIAQAMAKQSVLDELHKIEVIKDSLRDKTLDKISKKLGIDRSSINAEELSDYIAIESTPTTRYENPAGGYQLSQLPPRTQFYAPLCKVAWDQSEPYNYDMPIDTIAHKEVDGVHYYTEGNIPVGCANLTLGQLLTVIQPSITGLNTFGQSVSLDWGLITMTPNLYVDPFDPWLSSPQEQVDMVTSLLRRIYSLSNSTYDRNPTTRVVEQVSVSPEGVMNVISMYANYSGHIWDIKFNPINAMSSIMGGKPLMIGAMMQHFINGKLQKDPAGHVFLLDGIAICRRTLSPGYYVSEMYFHINTGWGNNVQPSYFKSHDNNTPHADLYFEVGSQGFFINTKDVGHVYNITKR